MNSFSLVKYSSCDKMQYNSNSKIITDCSAHYPTFNQKENNNFLSDDNMSLKNYIENKLNIIKNDKIILNYYNMLELHEKEIQKHINKIDDVNHIILE